MNNPTLKIGYEAKRIAANKVGLGNYSRTLIKQLAQYAPEHDYHLYSPVPFNSDLFDTEGHPSIKTHAPSEKPNPIQQHFLRYHKIRKQVQQDKLELYHGLSHTLPKKLSCPTIVTMHDLIFLRYPQFYPVIDRWFYYKTFKESANRADLIFSVSEATKEDICTYFDIPPEKILVTQQSCEDRFRSDIAPDELTRVQQKYNLPKKFILSLGTIEPRKNTANLVRGFAKVSKELNDFSLVFVGKETPYVKRVKQVLAESNLTNRAQFLGYVDFDDIPALYNLSSLFAYLSIVEGFGIPLLEAMNCGTPAITSNQSSLKEIVGDEEVLLVNPLDVTSIAEGLLHSLQSENEYQRLQKHIAQQIKKFTPKLICQRILDAYKTLT